MQCEAVRMMSSRSIKDEVSSRSLACNLSRHDLMDARSSAGDIVIALSLIAYSFDLSE